jgi:hypothetical protein
MGIDNTAKASASSAPTENSQPAAAETPAGLTPQPGSHDATLAASQLTPEEQMARFAAALKEEDWGHQPC